MEQFNGATRELAKEHRLPLFDLAQEPRQDPSYDLDGIHFSNAGTAEVARLLEPFMVKERERLEER